MVRLAAPGDAAPQPAADDVGRFRFTLGPAPAGNSGRYVLAAMEGLGLDWAAIGDRFEPGELTLRVRQTALHR